MPVAGKRERRPRLADSTWVHRLTWALVVVAACLVSAWAAGITEPTSSNVVFLDDTVGLIFVVAAAASGGRRLERAWFVAVGLAWPLGVVEPTRSLHAALLLMALGTFPTGQIRRAWQLCVACSAVLVTLQVLDQVATAVAFAGCALGSALTRRRLRAGSSYPALAALCVAGVLATSSYLARFRPDQFRPSAAVVAYEAVLALVAVGYIVAERAEAGRRAALADRLVSDAGEAGLSGLEVLLRGVLRDPQLQIIPAADPRPPAAGWQVMSVVEDSVVVARITHRTRALEDPATAAGVCAAVRLTIVQTRRQAKLAQRVAELEAARARLVGSVDAERQRAASSLRADLATLERAAADLDDLRRDSQSEDDRILEIVREQIIQTSSEIEDLIAGVPPVALGAGRLLSALQGLAERSPLPVSVSFDASASAGVEQERSLYYVCLEALTNAVKHAKATSAGIEVRRSGESLSVTFRDDGAGGADLSGSGLLGLADRLAAYGGRLEVQTARGAGTVLTATIPLTGSSATASEPAPRREPVQD